MTVPGRAASLALVAAAVLGLLHPALGMALIGDDYEWVQHAHRAFHDPRVLLDWMGGYWRPSSTWMFALDRILWGPSARGARLDNLALHALNAVLLQWSARRLGLGAWAALVVALLWAGSPFSVEIAIAPAMRADALLLTGWLALLIGWPGEAERWSRRRLAAVLLGLFLAAASKETWVVAPGLAFLLERFHRRREWRQVLRATALVALAVVVYLVPYRLAMPAGQLGYYRFELGPAAKLPHLLSVFLHLQDHAPLEFPVGWRGVLGSLAVLAALAHAWRRRAAAALVGAGLLLLPLLPILLMPYMPTRYVAIPYAGFLLLLAGLVRGRAAAGVALALAALVGVAGAFYVRGDLDDYGRVAAAHEPLLAEARAAQPGLPRDRPVVSVRAEALNPLAGIAAEPRGFLKLHYVRGRDPYGLIDISALMEYTSGDAGLLLASIEPEAVAPEAPAPALLVHEAGGFRWEPPGPDPLREVVRGLEARGFRVKAFTRWRRDEGR